MARTKEFDETATLDRALEWFWVHGFDGTSVQQLIDHLGISRSSLYDTYGEKHGLFITTLQRYIERSENYHAEAVADEAPAMDVLRRIMDDQWAQQQRLKDRRGCFVANTTTELAMHDKKVAKLVKECGARAEEAFAAIITRGKREGSVRKDVDPAKAATFLYTTLAGMNVQVRCGLTETGFQAIRDTTLMALAARP